MNQTIQVTKNNNNIFCEIRELFYFSDYFFRFFLKLSFEFKELLQKCHQMGCRSLLLVLVVESIIRLQLTLYPRPTLVQFGSILTMLCILEISSVSEIGRVSVNLVNARRKATRTVAKAHPLEFTEQIDTVEIYCNSTLKLLVMSHILTATLVLSLLVIIETMIRYGHSLMESLKGDLSFQLHNNTSFDVRSFGDFVLEKVKSFFLDLLIGFLGCYGCYHCKMRTVGIGNTTNTAMAIA